MISNKILTRGETDAALLPLCLREKEIMLKRERRYGPGTEPREGSCLTPHRRPCLFPQKPTAKTIKSMMAVSPLALHCCHLPSLGGVAYLHRIIHLLRHQRWHQLCLRKQGNKGYEGGHLVRSSWWLFLWRVDSNGARGYCLYWSGHGCKRVLLWGCTLLIGNYLTNKGFEANAPASAPNFSFGAASLSSSATPVAPRVFAPASSQAFSFGTGMYQPRSRGGRASQPSDRYCSPPL